MKVYIVFVFLFFNFNLQAEIYKWVDAKGNAHFSQNINDVPDSQEVREVKIKTSNISQSAQSKVAPSSIETNKNKNKTSKYNSKQLEKKCNQLSRIWALDPNGFNSSSYRESRKLGCGKIAMKRLRN